MKIIDISPLISEKIGVWPGDTPFSRRELMSIRSGANIDLSTIQTTVHLGAHVDAPSHYAAQSPSIDQVNLEPYIGLAQVIEVGVKGQRILPKDIREEIGAPRVLFKTGSFQNPNVFTTNFSSLSKELVDFLASKKVCLIGVDTPSIDPFDDKILEAHTAIRKHSIYNIEGLVLEKVTPGIYKFVALPLKIEGADASPVRAILYEDERNL